MAESCENLARSVIRALQRKKPGVLIVDETSLRDRLKAMVVSVACEGRAVRGGGTVKPGKSWRRKAKAFKSAGGGGRLGGAHFTVLDMISRGIRERIIHR